MGRGKTYLLDNLSNAIPSVLGEKSTHHHLIAALQGQNRRFSALSIAFVHAVDFGVS